MRGRSVTGMAGLGTGGYPLSILVPPARNRCIISTAIIIHNGEVYNYRELRTLQSKGYFFFGPIAKLAAYDLYGPAAANSSTAYIALWDEKETLFPAPGLFRRKSLFFLRMENNSSCQRNEGAGAAGEKRKATKNATLMIGYNAQNPADGYETFFRASGNYRPGTISPIMPTRPVWKSKNIGTR